MAVDSQSWTAIGCLNITRSVPTVSSIATADLHIIFDCVYIVIPDDIMLHVILHSMNSYFLLPYNYS